MLKTLVILTPGFPENEADSTCIPPQQIFVKALKEVNPGTNIIVLTFQYPFFSGEYDWNGIKVIAFGGKKQGRISRRLIQLKVWMTLKELYKSHQIMGLLSFWLGPCAFIGSSFAKKNKLPHYSWLLGQDAKAGNKYFNMIKPASESLIAISDFVAEKLNTNYNVLPQHVIPVGVDTALFSNADIIKDIDILGAGSLIPLKQYHVFLEVIASLKETHPDIKTMICGDGPEMKKLQATVTSMGLKNNVSLIGRLAHPDVLALMQRSKVLLHPSNYEGFSTVCLEALYAGADVVSFIRPMNEDIANWYIATDTAEMIKTLQDIFQNPKTEYQRVLPYRVQNSAKAIVGLFNHR
jgi:glycosyltransferase involved in cell wall biosynthesis